MQYLTINTNFHLPRSWTNEELFFTAFAFDFVLWPPLYRQRGKCTEPGKRYLHGSPHEKGEKRKEIKSRGQGRLDLTVTLCWMHLSLVSCTPPHFPRITHGLPIRQPSEQNKEKWKPRKLEDNRAARTLRLSKCRCMVHREQKTETRYHMKQNRAERHTSWYSPPEETTVML